MCSKRKANADANGHDVDGDATMEDVANKTEGGGGERRAAKRSKSTTSEAPNATMADKEEKRITSSPPAAPPTNAVAPKGGGFGRLSRLPHAVLAFVLSEFLSFNEAVTVVLPINRSVQVLVRALPFRTLSFRSRIERVGQYFAHDTELIFCKKDIRLCGILRINLRRVIR